jgi:hypothetical protein
MIRKILFILLFSVFIISCDNNTTTDNTPCSPNPCAESPIAHKTVCEPLGDTDFTCICENGYELDVRTNLCIRPEIDPCDPNPCIEENKTKCIIVGVDAPIYPNNDAPTSPQCVCNDGYTDNNGICEEIQTTKIRIMAANITSGRKQSYKPNGIRMFQALKPDIILIQEFNYLDEYDDELPIRDLVDIAFGTEFNYFRGSGRIPNGIISRYPIVESGNWDDSSVTDREIAYAKIKLPNNKFLWAISVHLSTKDNLDGARDSVAAITAKNIPADDYIVYGGDFNTKSRTAGTVNELGSIFNVSAPWPKGYNDFSNPDTCFKCYTNYEPGECGDKFNCDPTATSYERDDPYDWVIADKNNLHPLQTPTIYCSENSETDCLTFNDGIVFDSRDFTQEELDRFFFPVLVGDCNRDTGDDYMNFQHMAVVKDFLIPNQK